MQDKAIAQIGKYALSRQVQQEPYLLFVQNLQPNRDFQMLLIDVGLGKDDNGAWKAEYKGVDFQRVGESNYRAYGYRKGSARGGDITFTTKYGDPEKKIPSMLKNLFPKAIGQATNQGWQDEKGKLEALLTELKLHQDQLVQDLQLAHQSLDKQEQMKAGLSVRAFIEDEAILPVAWQSMQALLIESGTEGNATKYNVTSKAVNQLCSVCYQKRELIYGFGSPFKYATVDKPGMVSGFFEQKNNWKNYPICSDCTLQMEMGSLYMQQHLRRSFYGASYFMMPQLVLNSQSGHMARILREMDDLYEATKDVPIGMREDSVLRRIGQMDNYFMLNLLFFEENPTTKAIRIQLQLNEIFPSRFRLLFENIPQKINRHQLFKQSYSEKKQLKDLRFAFGFLKDFFTTDFYSFIQKVFLGQNISLALVYAGFMDKIREHYRKSKSSSTAYVEPVPLTILKAYMVLGYLSHLDIIPLKSFTIMEEQVMGEAVIADEKEKQQFSFSLLESFLENQPEFFDTPGKKGVFALGVLVKQVMNLQYSSLKSTPFEKKLKGYQVNLADLRHIYVEAISLLKKYLKANNMAPNAYQDLRELTAEYFAVQNASLSTLDNNELAFYFVSGLELTKRFYQSKK